MIKSMRGQLIKQDNNLVFVVDGTPKTTVSQNKYRFLNNTFKSIADFKKRIAELDGAPVSFQQVRLVDATSGSAAFPPSVNQRFDLQDQQGELFSMKNIYSFIFLKNDIDPSKELDIFALVGHDFDSGEPILFPILAHEHNTTANSLITLNEDLLSYKVRESGIALYANEDCAATIYSVHGEVITQLSLTAKGEQVVTLPSGSYVIVATSPNNQSYYTTKVVL